MERQPPPPGRALWRASGLLLVWVALVIMLVPMQGAWFAVDDDHRVAILAGADQEVSAAEAVRGAREWMWETNGRFRPFFWVLWHAEALWAGLDPLRWHRDRLLLALVAGTALYLAAEAVLPPLLAAPAAFTFFCGFQNEIWMRLVVQESYGAVLTALGAAVVARRLAHGRDSPADLLPGLLFLALAGLTKESFVPLLPGVLILVYVVRPRLSGPREPLAGRDRVLLAGLALTSVALCAAVVGVRLAYGPYYLDSATLPSLASNAWRHLWLITKDSAWPIPLAAAAAAVGGTRAGFAVGVKPGALLLAGAVLLLVPQWIVHGAGSIEGRYLVPGCLFAVLASASGLWTLHQLRERRLGAALTALAVASLVAFEAKWVLRDHHVAQARAAGTREYRDAIEAVATALASQPSLDVVFRTEDPFDIGRVDSAWGFLRARLGEGFVPYLMATDERRSARGRALGDHLAALQRERAEGRTPTFRSWASHVGSREHCLEVVFHADPRRAVCRQRVAFPDPDPRLTDGPAAP